MPLLPSAMPMEPATETAAVSVSALTFVLEELMVDLVIVAMVSLSRVATAALPAPPTMDFPALPIFAATPTAKSAT